MKSKTKAIFSVAALLLSGALFGATLTYYFVPLRARAVAADRDGRDKHRSGPPSAVEVSKVLKDRLQLREDQVVRLLPILREGRDRYKALGQESEEKFQQARNQTRDKIRAMLDPAQLERYEQFIQEHEKRGKERQHRK